MIDAPLALAFTAGMVATVNPCGFAMLPAYLGYFLGLEPGPDEASDPSAGLVRALVVGLVVSAGFLVLFAVAGAVVSWTSFAIGEWSPWLTILIGLALVALGIGFVTGWQPKLAMPRLDKGGQDRGLWSMFLFGLSYAVASLSCTIGPFTSVVASTFSRASVVSGLATFLAYGLGMAVLLIVLTVTLALARQGLAAGLRRALPWVQRASGVLVVLMGAYLAWYGVFELRVARTGRTTGQGPVDRVTNWSANLSGHLVNVDPLQAALAGALVVAAVVLVALLRAGRSDPGDVSD